MGDGERECGRGGARSCSIHAYTVATMMGDFNAPFLGHPHDYNLPRKQGYIQRFTTEATEGTETDEENSRDNARLILSKFKAQGPSVFSVVNFHGIRGRRE